MNLKFSLFGLVSFASLCWGTLPTIDLEPKDPYVFLGECITLSCTVSSTQYGNSSSLYMTFKEKRFPDDHFEIVDEYTIRFNRCITNLSQVGSHYCKQDIMTDGVKTNLIFDGEYIHVEKALVPIPKDTIHCFIIDWLIMNCTWSLGETYVEENEINVNFTSIIAMGVQNCPNLVPTSCEWKKGDIEFTAPFQFNLTVFHQKRLDKKLVTTYHVPRRKPVKLSKVKYLGPNSIWTNSSCFKIKWKYRYSYKVNFLVTFDSKSDEKQKYNTGSKQNFEVCGLLPGENYHVNISASPKLHVDSSNDPLILEVFTNKTYPSQSPLLTNNSFTWTADKSAVFIYWKCLTRRQYGAENVNYLISIENQTTLVNSGRTAVKLPPVKRDEKCWFIQLWAVNSLGRSETFSSMTICNYTSVPPAPEDVEMLVVNNTHVKVMWSNPVSEEVSVSSIQILAYKNCSVDLLRWVVDAKKDSVILQVENNDEYSFGVVALNANGSSGITWGSCRYSMKRPLKPVDVLSAETFNDKLQIDWVPYNCEIEKAYIIEYLIKYCIALNGSSCNEREKVLSVPRSERKFKTAQLLPNDYLVWVEPVTYGGSGPSSMKKMVHIVDSPLGVGAIIAILVSCTGVFIFFIFLYRKISSQLEKCDPKVDIPTITDSFGVSRISEPKNDMSINTGKKSSPTSSAITEITRLSSNSVCNSRYGSPEMLHTYVHVDQDSLNSQASTEPSNENLKLSLQFTPEQNANNNAFCQDAAQSDYVPFDQFSNYSNQSKNSKSSLDQLLGDSNRNRDYISTGSLSHVLPHFEWNPLAAENMGENPSDFPDYVKHSFVEANKLGFCTDREVAENVPSNKYPPGGKSGLNLNITQTSDENLLPHESNGDYWKSQINESVLSENCDTLTKEEMPSKFSGKEDGNNSVLDEMDEASYVKVDDFQVAEKDINLNDFDAQSLKPIDGGNVHDNYLCEVPV